MRYPRFVTWALIVSLLGGSWFALEGAVSVSRSRSDRDRFVAQLGEARALLSGPSDVFKTGSGASAGAPQLKPLLQESSTTHGLQLGFLSETDRDAGKGRREKQVSARLVRTPHDKLVPFLADLERRGQGGTVKELHLRSSKDTSDVYEEVELVFSRITLLSKGKP